MRTPLSIIILIGILLGSPDAIRAAGENRISTQVLRADTVWSGEIDVDGVVVVSRAATLTIMPGTTVRFHRRDDNRDGIGDGEIRVLGRLHAVGTASDKIRFLSAESPARESDWSYVLLYATARASEIRYCEFSHAFTGLQVHFSRAAVSDCLFSSNNEGLRFGRAALSVTHNRFQDNTIAIRFTRMEGPAEIRGNVITGNQTGIFVVPSGQNIKDFFEPDRSGRPWNTGRLTITANDVHDNSWYNLNLGEKQIWDLDVAGNWWGTTSSKESRVKIFDRNRDQALGLALIEPMAPEPITGAGIRERLPDTQ